VYVCSNQHAAKGNEEVGRSVGRPRERRETRDGSAASQVQNEVRKQREDRSGRGAIVQLTVGTRRMNDVGRSFRREKMSVSERERERERER
jgi:hypothetical protein